MIQIQITTKELVYLFNSCISLIHLISENKIVLTDELVVSTCWTHSLQFTLML